MNAKSLRTALIKKLAGLKNKSSPSKDRLISFIKHGTAYVAQENEMIFRIKPAVKAIAITWGK